jgi:hypothetical protein
VSEKIRNPFVGKLGPARAAFHLDGRIVWGASVAEGDDGRYYMAASTWPVERGSWVTDSVIVLASADEPMGPYTYEQEILGARGREHWDGMMAHNPAIQKHDGRYYLFYTGTTYTRPRPTGPISARTHEIVKEAWENKQLGLAIADDPHGPWQRLDTPILSPREGHWDSILTSNAAPFIHPDGSVSLIYKSLSRPHPGTDVDEAAHAEMWAAMSGRISAEENPELARRGREEAQKWLTVGFARAERPEGPYERVGDHDGLALIEGKRQILEDACLWHDGKVYHMVLKSFDLEIIDERNGGVYVTSRNGVDWCYPEGGPKAYGLTVAWADGTTTKMNRLERPQVLLKDGVPAYLFLATSFDDLSEAPFDGVQFNTVMPVEQDG